MAFSCLAFFFMFKICICCAERRPPRWGAASLRASLRPATPFAESPPGRWRRASAPLGATQCSQRTETASGLPHEPRGGPSADAAWRSGPCGATRLARPPTCAWCRRSGRPSRGRWPPRPPGPAGSLLAGTAAGSSVPAPCRGEGRDAWGAGSGLWARPFGKALSSSVWGR